MTENNNEKMTDNQYKKLTEIMEGVKDDVSDLNTSFVEMDKQINSISNYISGDPNIKGQKGSRDKINKLEDDVNFLKEKAVVLEKIDTINKDVDELKEDNTRFKTIYATLYTILSVILALMGFELL